MSGAAGGLLLGATAVVGLMSLELLADNRLLMDQLENYIMNYPFKEIGAISRRANYDHVHNTYISILVEEFGAFSSTLSLNIGIFIGLSTYAQVIKTYSEAVMGKALALESFLFITSSIMIFWWFVIFQVLLPVVLLIFLFFVSHCHHMAPFTVWLLTPAVIWAVVPIDIWVRTKLTLMIAVFPKIWGVTQFENTNDFQLTIAPVPLMLIITDVFNIVGQPIVTLQLQTSTNTSSAVPEGIFVGVLTSQLFTVIIGMSLFVSWQRGGADKICGSAAGAAAILGAIKFTLPMLGPGPIIGVLIGLAGAVGVSLSAAGAVTNCYGQAVEWYGLVGRLGMTVGAAVGTFLSSCVHSGLSVTFMGLCAATIPAGVHLEQLFLFLWQKFQVYLCIILFVIILIWIYFTSTLYFAYMFIFCDCFIVLFIIFLCFVLAIYGLAIFVVCRDE